jgi:hypothetical protein
VTRRVNQVDQESRSAMPQSRHTHHRRSSEGYP